MTLTRKFGAWIFVMIAAWLLVAVPTRSEGPVLVGGPSTASQPQAEGLPYTWGDTGTHVPFNGSTHTLSYWTDMGNLGSQSNSAADQLVQNAFQSWQNVTTANIQFSQAGKLGQDVTASNIMAVRNALEDCSTLPNAPSGGIAQPVSVIYDADGSIFSALGEDPNSVGGVADAVCYSSDGTNNYFRRGEAILNGAIDDGSAASINILTAVMVHEFGHMIGLDHSQIDHLDCLTTICSAADLAGVPIMFPVLIDDKTSPTRDDIAGVSALYPETANDPANGHVLFSTLGGIQGRVFFTDGTTQAQGYNVIARSTLNPNTVAVSNVSGFLYTDEVGNTAIPSSLSDEIFFSHDPTLIGFFDIPGLPAGSYTLEVEAINNSGDNPFTYGSSVGPIGILGFQFPLPTQWPTPPPCSTEYLVSNQPATCSKAGATQLLVSAGSTLTSGTDINLIATPPRYDAWEDGP